LITTVNLTTAVCFTWAVIIEVVPFSEQNGTHT